MAQQIAKDLDEIKKDLAFIKDILLLKRESDDEGELSDWAKKELSEARKRSDYVSQQKVKKIILGK